MILLAHLLLGALIGSKINNIFLAVILAFLSHYFLDLFPHIEYPIENIEKKQWKKALPDVLRVLLDFSIGILLISLLSKNQIVVYVCAFFAIAPDGLSLLESITGNKILKKHSTIHQEKIHIFKYKKVSSFWRILSQVIAVIIFSILFKV
jgi:hypothetical protein